MKTFIIVLLLSVGMKAQTPLTNVSLPPYIFGGLSYNQYTGIAGVVSGIIPESQSISLYGSATADVIPVQVTDPTTKLTHYLLSSSFRAGQHKVVYNDGKNVALIGGDFGATFSGSSASSPGINVGLAGSFTITYLRQLSPHWGIAVPIRMLWMSGVGPGGSGAWNPVVEVGVVFKP